MNFSDFSNMSDYLNALRNQVENENKSMEENENLDYIDIFKENFTDILENYEMNNILNLEDDKTKRLFDILDTNDFEFDEILSFYKYSSSSNMIQSFLANEESKDDIFDGICCELEDRLFEYDYTDEEIDAIFNRMNEADFSKTLNEQINEFQEFVKGDANVAIEDFVKNIYRYRNLEKTCKDLINLVTNHPIGHEVTVYRGINTQAILDAVGVDSIHNIKKGDYINGSDRVSSSSLNYGKAFHQYPVIMKIHLKETDNGFYGKNVSVFSEIEDELLIKDTGFRINSINTDYIDKSGRHKILLEVEPELEKDLKIDNDSLNIAS